MLYSELFAAHLKQLKTGELSNAVEILIEKAFAISRTQFWIKKNQSVRDGGNLRKFRRYFRRLLADEPLAYILKEKEFFGEKFMVSPAVLIPRPETELLVEKALDIIGKKPARILDIGAGSGCISIVLALKSRVLVTALEISPPALGVLKKNIARFGLQKRIKALKADLFPKKPELFQMIVANPPYLSKKDWDILPPGIRDFEPRGALIAGPAGTEALERIIAGAPGYLQSGGYLLLEIGQGQLRAVRVFLKRAGLRETNCICDYGGIARVIAACL
ncbi:MAG: peptide chain release factor N(5)-glutamine methyltransferase [Candidatus Aminicenantes bacterium]|nr:peptide chain release factor N(5)-glutamine methyltransferase [Candidatus Aminicenantes bacterium]